MVFNLQMIIVAYFDFKLEQKSTGFFKLYMMTYEA